MGVVSAKKALTRKRKKKEKEEGPYSRSRALDRGVASARIKRKNKDLVQGGGRWRGA
jgi:hypothetical protein